MEEIDKIIRKFIDKDWNLLYYTSGGLYIYKRGGYSAMVIETESLKSRILKLQKDLGRIAANREDITSEDVLKLSRDLDDLIVEYTRSVNKTI
jgi:hypothetical protein